MKLIHEGGYSRDERESFKEIIFSNTVQSMRVILEAMESLELPLEDQRMEYHVQTIFMQPAQIEGDVLPPEVGGAIEALWKDRGVQECFKRSRELPAQRLGEIVRRHLAVPSAVPRCPPPSSPFPIPLWPESCAPRPRQT